MAGRQQAGLRPLLQPMREHQWHPMVVPRDGPEACWISSSMALWGLAPHKWFYASHHECTDSERVDISCLISA